MVLHNPNIAIMQLINCDFNLFKSQSNIAFRIIGFLKNLRFSVVCPGELQSPKKVGKFVKINYKTPATKLLKED